MTMMTLRSGIARRGPGAAGRWLALGGAFGLALGGPAGAEEVDAELLILVDTSVAVSGGDFIDLLEGYASAFESGQFTGALESESGRGIAASLVFFGDAGTQVVGVPWMRLSDASSAEAFADLVRGATRPPGSVLVSVSEGLAFATEQFGSETGFSGNGFESRTQAINVTTETFVLLGETAGTVSAARQDALDAGVDVINAITVGSFNVAGATAYYEANIVGGESEGVPGSVVNAPSYADLSAVAAGALTAQLLSIVPEPRGSFLVMLAAAGLVLRRRR